MERNFVVHVVGNVHLPVGPFSSHLRREQCLGPDAITNPHDAQLQAAAVR